MQAPLEPECSEFLILVIADGAESDVKHAVEHARPFGVRNAGNRVDGTGAVLIVVKSSGTDQKLHISLCARLTSGGLEQDLEPLDEQIVTAGQEREHAACKPEPEFHRLAR